MDEFTIRIVLLHIALCLLSRSGNTKTLRDAKKKMVASLLIHHFLFSFQKWYSTRAWVVTGLALPEHRERSWVVARLQRRV
jgi:hypothetical protein